MTVIQRTKKVKRAALYTELLSTIFKVPLQTLPLLCKFHRISQFFFIIMGYIMFVTSKKKLVIFKTFTFNGEEVISMTVASQVKTCVASLKSAQASLEQFALETQNQEAKSLFTNASQQTQQILYQVESRVQQLENEEPQYKGF
jgi:hypothetical protein